jgi:hypothetical protein
MIEVAICVFENDGEEARSNPVMRFYRFYNSCHYSNARSNMCLITLHTTIEKCIFVNGTKTSTSTLTSSNF